VRLSKSKWKQRRVGEIIGKWKTLKYALHNSDKIVVKELINDGKFLKNECLVFSEITRLAIII